MCFLTGSVFVMFEIVCVCVFTRRLQVCSVASTSGPGHVNKPRAAESVLRKAQKDIKDREK